MNLWQALASNHISHSIRASTSIIQHPRLSGWQQQYRAVIKDADIFHVFNIFGPIFSFFFCVESHYSHPWGTDATSHVMSSQTVQSSCYCFLKPRLHILCSKAPWRAFIACSVHNMFPLPAISKHTLKWEQYPVMFWLTASAVWLPKSPYHSIITRATENWRFKNYSYLISVVGSAEVLKDVQLREQIMNWEVKRNPHRLALQEHPQPSV